MAPQFIFEMHDVTKRYGEQIVLLRISLSFYCGAKIGVVGENGAGKSTLLKIMAGIDTDIDGTASLTKGMRVRYVAQEPALELDKTVRENLRTAVQPIQDLIDRFNGISARLSDPQPDDDMDKLVDEMGQLQEKIDACNAWELDRMLDIASDAMVLPPDDAPVRRLSGGERRRVALAMALLEKPDLLLLDEPTNHLDAETVQWLEQQLREYPGTVIIVTHDRYFLDNITKWILELENTRGIPFEGNYSSWLEQKSELLRVMEKKESQRQKTLQRELDWIRNSHEGRKQKNDARIKAYEELAAQNTVDTKSEAVIQIAPGPRLGDKVLTAKDLYKSFQHNGEELKLIEACSFDLPRGAIVGVIGPNGTGKTTLFRMITGQEKPDAGSLELGSSVMLSYVDQHRDALDAEKTIFEEITDGKDKIELGNVSMNSRVYVARFNFRGTQQQKRVGDCSGGERNRIHLAKMLRRGGNLLLLDEPTNDLDVNTMRVLEQALIDFPGCAMVISHDRFFLDRICTHLLIMEGDGGTRWFEGNFAAYEEMVMAETPERLAHRRGKYHRLAL
jgi:energy-dependent translational throttle protein EttA